MNDLTVSFDTDAFVLSLIGLLPGVGDIAKDQISAAIHKREIERIRECIKRVEDRLSKRLTDTKLNDTQKSQVANLCITTFQRVRGEGIQEKRRLFSDILANTISLNLDALRMDWMQRSVDKISMLSIEFLRELSKPGYNPGNPIHSHSGILAELEKKYTYSYLVALIRELESIGLIDLRIDHSSVVGGNAKFIAFWKTTADDFMNFIKES